MLRARSNQGREPVSKSHANMPRRAETSMNLLIVEDEKRMAELLRKGLEEEGHAVVCAADGIEGLEMSRAYDFDMIILDVMMPKLDGYELAKKLRSDKIS